MIITASMKKEAKMDDFDSSKSLHFMIIIITAVAMGIVIIGITIPPATTAVIIAARTPPPLAAIITATAVARAPTAIITAVATAPAVLVTSLTTGMAVATNKAMIKVKTVIIMDPIAATKVTAYRSVPINPQPFL